MDSPILDTLPAVPSSPPGPGRGPLLPSTPTHSILMPHHHNNHEDMDRCIQCDGKTRKNHMECFPAIYDTLHKLCKKCCIFCNPDGIQNPIQKYCAACHLPITILRNTDGSGICLFCKRACEWCGEYYFQTDLRKISHRCWICRGCIPGLQERLRVE
jgi:hypothetical protein